MYNVTLSPVFEIPVCAMYACVHVCMRKLASSHLWFLFPSRELCTFAAGADDLDTANAMASGSVAKIPIGKFVSTVIARIQLSDKTCSKNLLCAASRAGKRTFARQTNARTSPISCKVQRRWIRVAQSHQQQLESVYAQVEQNEKCNFEWGDKILPKIFR